MINTVILDFDGVILESVSVKTEAFRALFSFSPVHLDEIVEYHLSHGGVSRYDKFRYIYTKILNAELSEEQFHYLSDRFAELVLEGVLKSPYVDGALVFLEKYYQNLNLFVVSATPEDELKSIIWRRGLVHYFDGIFGAPRKKADCIEKILQLPGITSDSTIFVGDSSNDLEAAQKTGIRFIGRIMKGDINRFDSQPGTERVITDLHELLGFIEENS